MSTLPEFGFLRLPQIIGSKAVTPEQAERNREQAEREKAAGRRPNVKPKKPRPAVQGLIPVSATVWWQGIRTGRYPAPVKLGTHAVGWRVEDIRTLLSHLENQSGGDEELPRFTNRKSEVAARIQRCLSLAYGKKP